MVSPRSAMWASEPRQEEWLLCSQMVPFSSGRLISSHWLALASEEEVLMATNELSLVPSWARWRSSVDFSSGIWYLDVLCWHMLPVSVLEVSIEACVRVCRCVKGGLTRVWVYFQDPLHLWGTVLQPTSYHHLFLHRGKTSEPAENCLVVWDGSRDVTTEEHICSSPGSLHSSAEVFSIATSE